MSGGPQNVRVLFGRYRLYHISVPRLLQSVDHDAFARLEPGDYDLVISILHPGNDFPPFHLVLRIDHINESSKLLAEDRRLLDHDPFLNR